MLCFYIAKKKENRSCLVLQIQFFDTIMLTASARCLSLSALPRVNALGCIRQASHSSNKNKDEPVAVSTPSHDDSGPSPMSQRPLPPDDGKVRMYP